MEIPFINTPIILHLCSGTFPGNFLLIPSCLEGQMDYLPSILAKSDVNFQITPGVTALSRYLSEITYPNIQIVSLLVEAGRAIAFM